MSIAIPMDTHLFTESSKFYVASNIQVPDFAVVSVAVPGTPENVTDLEPYEAVQLANALLVAAHRVQAARPIPFKVVGM